MFILAETLPLVELSFLVASAWTAGHLYMARNKLQK